MTAFVLAAALFGGCGGEVGENSVIKIGSCGPLTGPYAEYGTAVEAGMQIAVDEINARGGIQLALRMEDDEGDGEKAVAAYNTLKDWGMQVFAGAVTTGAANAVAPETAADGIFMLTPSASAVSVPLAGENVFQLCVNDPSQGASAAQLVSDLELGEAVGIIYDASDAYSAGICEGFRARAGELGVPVVCCTAFTQDSKSDLSAQLTQCRDAGADLVFLPFYYTEAAQVLSYAAKIAYTPAFFGCDGMDGILSVEGFDAALAEGLMLVTPFDAAAGDEATRAFTEAYRVRMDGRLPNQFAADGYDAVYAVYEALTAADADASLSPPDMCAKLTEQFRAMQFDGLTGCAMTWDENGMVAKLPAAVVIRNGVYVPLT